MPSFDVVSKVSQHELNNAVDQANREVSNRFDFKGSNANFKLEDNKIALQASSEFQLKQMNDILSSKLSKRQIDVKSLDIQLPEINNQEARQTIIVKQGIDSLIAKNILKLVKNTKIKVQAAIQGDQIRVSGKKRDDLQTIISLLKNEIKELPLQFENFRD